MRQQFVKVLIASGFVFLVGMIFISIGIVIKENNLLSKEHAVLFPPTQHFPLNSCLMGSSIVAKSYSVDKKVRESIPILMYHRIVKESNLNKSHYINGEVNPMVVLREEFERQMTYLKENGYSTLTMVELYLFLKNEIEIPENSVVLTFDDGYKDNFIEAYPILKKYNFHATNFVITGAITRRVHTFNPKNVQYFSEKELTKACDVFEYQSHTYSYHRQEESAQGKEVSFLTSKSNEQIIEDIQISIDQLNGENLAFAYPYGEYWPSTIEIIKELGFKMAFTTENRAATRKDHLYEIPRFNILASTTFEQFIEYIGAE